MSDEVTEIGRSADANEADELVSDDEPESAEAADASAGGLPAVVVAPEDGSIPEGYAIKGNTNSMKYHVPGTRYYDITIAELFFDTAESAEAAGYEAPAGSEEDRRRTK